MIRRLGLFGHHPHPAIDFCVEVDAIEGRVYDARHGLTPFKPVEERVFKAMQFRLGGELVAVQAKERLRIAGAYLANTH